MAARHSSAALWAYLLHVLLWTGAECQTPKPYERLPSEPLFPSDTGEFTWPAGDSTGSFTEGAEMNISWTTTYPAINLWLIINQSWAQPSSIICEHSYQRQSVEHALISSSKLWRKLILMDRLVWPELQHSISATRSDSRAKRMGARAWWVLQSSILDQINERRPIFVIDDKYRPIDARSIPLCL